jgi:hypothetical protein
MSSGGGHSSNVQIRLIVDDRILGVSQVGDRSFILRETDFECPPETEGEIVIVVDGHVSRYRVILDKGIARDTPDIVYTDVERLPPPKNGMLFDEPIPF